MKPVSFSSLEINKPLPVDVSSECLVGQTQVQKLTLAAATNQMPDIT